MRKDSSGIKRGRTMGRRVVPFVLAAVMTAAVPMQTFGASTDYDADTWVRLQDNTMEYSEIENLVVEYNPMYLMMNQGIAYNTYPVMRGVEDLREQQAELHTLREMAKEEENEMAEAMYKELEKEVKKSADKMEKSVTNATRLTVNSTRKTLTSTVQGLFITYHQQLSTREMLEAVSTLSQAMYEMSQTQYSIGMATETQVQAALKDWQEAQNNLQKIEDAIVTIRQNLCIMTGWAYDAIPEIGKVPEPDLSRIQTMDLAADTEEALKRNYTLMDLRKSAGNTPLEKQKVADAEGLVKTNMETLYQEVQKAKTAYEAAQTAWQGAQITKQGNDLKYQMGMLGKVEYLGTEVAFQQARMNYEQASMNLFQSMETYDWALQGLLDVQ